ncbi:LysR family transcriptional regulator [Saxibacter everestensis]|uniref:LysR family transcriptional regulator n=1 Tax=Saxibacter everestensis TaxID=2909229 RepID=A0ABY8QSG6_9MICO|nr:LysR family transcriptional regulator [Brevibacteriaceae bacterium ZFBP1038]
MRDIDLNLLPSLQVLLELRNVSRAAERMQMSQPAMSAALARLRRHFNDELLVREGRGYALTAFARALVPRVERAYAEVQDAMQLRSSFSPETSDRTFTIAASDYATSLLIRSLRTTMAKTAPRVSVDFVPTATMFLRPGLEVYTNVDIVVGPMGFDLIGESRQLFRDEFVALVDAGNPLLAEDRVTIADLAARPHAVGDFGSTVVTPPMQLFEECGAVPSVAARVTGFQGLPAVVEGTDLVAMVPRMLAAHASRSGHLAVVELDADLEAPLVEALYWHPLQTNDPANTWLRDLIKEAAAGLVTPEHAVHPVRVTRR